MFNVGSADVSPGAGLSASSASLRPAVPLWRRTPGRWLKPLVFLLALTPFVLLVQAVFGDALGPNPVEVLTAQTGEQAIRLLLLGLALTPLRHWLGNTWPVRLRRMVGLFAAFYVVLHVTIYAVLDRELELHLVIEDLVERPYIMAGFVAFLILIPLTLTSTKGMVRRLKQRWQVLHRWVYIAATAAVVHYVLLAKGDRIEPFVYLAILAFLLGWRFKRLLEGAGAPARAQAGTSARAPAGTST